ncbi:DUF736 domain-containing protein [Sphingobium sp. DEHP117]|uniref:DUF736 domain-containing protein n=1 Tax=Sphingobium sp. DEHP117 TaxID=2993436 RepID=UPI0027D66A38|nr:DUF736 family protein [Sphingobium sp. DEHP117]MDQ4422139.1 DUF736 domain-containing protein [Sphingobium sp. DEHP117]
MNIGEIKKNASGQLIGSVETLTMTRTIGLRPLSSTNPRAPRFEIVALNDQRRWVAVGALFELASNATGEIFYQGKIDDPSMSQPLYIAVFPREDGTMAVAWQRPRRRDNRLGASEYGDGDMFGSEEGTERSTGQSAAQAGDGLGDSTAEPPARRGRAQAKDAGSDSEGAIPPLVDA